MASRDQGARAMAGSLRRLILPLLRGVEHAAPEFKEAGHRVRMSVSVQRDGGMSDAEALQFGMAVEDLLLEHGYRLTPREWADPLWDESADPLGDQWVGVAWWMVRVRTPHSMHWSRDSSRTRMSWTVRCPVPDIPPVAQDDLTVLRAIVEEMFRSPMTKMEVARAVARCEGRDPPKSAPSSSRFTDDDSQWVDALWVRRTAPGRAHRLPSGTRVALNAPWFELMPLPMVAEAMVRVGCYTTERDFYLNLGIELPEGETR